MAPNKLRPSPKWGDSVAPKQTHRDDFLAQQRRPITGVLDGVTQNYNIGAIFQLRDAFPRPGVDPAGCPEHASAAVCRPLRTSRLLREISQDKNGEDDRIEPDPQAAQAGDLGEPGHAGVDAGGGEDDHRSPGIATWGAH